MNKTRRPSLNQLAETLAERQGRQYDHAFKEEMKVLIHIWRQRLLVDSLNSRPEDRQFFRIWIDVPLIDTPISEFPGFPNNHCVKRTKDCLPKALRANSTMYDFVGFLNKETPIPLESSVSLVKLKMNSRYTGDQPRSVAINGYIYVFNYSGPAISVSMIPEDMTEVPKLECYDCGDSGQCYTDDEPYPVSGDIAQRIIQAILSTELARNVIDPKTEEVPMNNEQR